MRRFALPGAITIRLEEAASVHPVDPYAAEFARAMRLRRGEAVLDMGCGAGGYGLAAAARGAGRVVLTDVSREAVATALRSAARLRFAVQGRVGSIFAPVRGEKFDVIMTSLPQLPGPRPVIDTRWGGPDGLAFLRKMIAEAHRFLNPRGRLYALVTDWADPRRVEPLFERHGYRVRTACRVWRAFQPAEYDALTPGLWAYLEARVAKGLAPYRRRGSWCYLGVSLLEATYRSG